MGAQVRRLPPVPAERVVQLARSGEARDANVEGVGAVTPRDLVRMSQRMNPDRVILGEVRGDEVVPLLNVMSQGNSGMCTLHADASATLLAAAGLPPFAVELVRDQEAPGNTRYGALLHAADEAS